MAKCPTSRREEPELRSKTSITQAIENVHAALFKLVQNHEHDIEEIALRARVTGGTGLHLANVERNGLQFVLTRIPSSELTSLTERQREIAFSVATGLSNKEIGNKLTIKPTTVASHLRVVYKKLKVTSRSTLMLRLFPTQR